jgi:hypothetical protein
MKRIRRHFGKSAIALTVVLVASWTPGPARAAELSNAEILRNFDVIAFQNEMRHIENPRVTKWTGPITAYKQFDIEVDSDAEDFLDRHMERLAEVTGLDISYVNELSAANFQIIFTRRSKYMATALKHMKPGRRGIAKGVASRLRRTNCLGVIAVKPSTGEIERAIVVIPYDHAKEHGILTRCIVEETTQAMGLPNDFDDANPSVFNDTSRLKDLSAHDILLLRLLYHPELEVGTPRRDALLTAARLLPLLRSQ